MEGVALLKGEQEIAQARDAFVERLFESILGTLDILTMFLGHELGLYQAMAGGKQFTPSELAGRTGTSQRYIREWLEQQATSGILTVHNPTDPPGERLFSLPPAHVEVLTDNRSLENDRGVPRK